MSPYNAERHTVNNYMSTGDTTRCEGACNVVVLSVVRANDGVNSEVCMWPVSVNMSGGHVTARSGRRGRYGIEYGTSVYYYDSLYGVGSTTTVCVHY